MSQIELDLTPFQNGITSSLLDQTVEYNMNNSRPGMTVVIYKKEIYYSIFGSVDIVQFSGHLQMIYKSLMCFDISDVEFVFLHGDNHYIPMSKPFPYFGHNRHVLEPSILFPWTQFLFNNEYHKKIVPWDQKISQVIFRGTTTGAMGNPDFKKWPRTKVVLLCRKRPELCNASFVKIVQATKSMAEEMLMLFNLSSRMNWSEEKMFKGNILVDGNGAPASRSAKVFSSGSTVFKHESQYIEFFYGYLRPWIHYIPFDKDVLDLESHLEWFLNNPVSSMQIAANSYMFSQKYFTDYVISNYISTLLNSYAKILQLDPHRLSFQRLNSSSFIKFKITTDHHLVLHLRKYADHTFRERCKIPSTKYFSTE